MKRARVIVALTAAIALSLGAQAIGAQGKSSAPGFKESGLPIVSKKATYKMVTRRRIVNGPWSDMIFFKRLEEKTGVHVEWTEVPEAQYSEKKNLIFAANDLPDAFFGRLSLTSSDIVLYSAQKMFIPLDDLIEKYAPNLKAVFAEHPDMKALATAPDGHIYSMPFVYAVGNSNVPDNIFLYKPWLDKLGLKVPTTIDEFYKVLKAFKEKDPNGNGKADEVPFTFVYGDVMSDMVGLFGSFGRADSHDGATKDIQHLIVDKGKVVFTADKSEYRDAIKYFSKYFAEGLIDKEGFVQDRKQWMAKGKTPEVTYGGFISWNDFDFGADRAKDYIVVPPLAGSDGKRHWTWRPIDNATGTGFSITPKAKSPEVLVRWADQFYDKQTSLEANFGPLDVNLVKKADGSFDYISTPAGMTYDEFRFKNAPAGDAPMAIFSEDFGKLIPRQPTMQKKYEDIMKYYKPYCTETMFPSGLMFTPEDTKRLQVLKTDIQKYVEETRASWLMGGNIDAEWRSYLAKLKDLGIDEYVKIYQRNYDRIYGKK
jgi:ABC-type sugar transport system, periplasmic component